MDFTPVSTTYLKARPVDPARQESETIAKAKTAIQSTEIDTVEIALETLKSQPDYDTLISVLQSLDHGRIAKSGFKISKPNPEAAQIIQCLVSEIIPNYWPLLKEDASTLRAGQGTDLELLLKSLRNVTGLNAAIIRLKALIQESKAGAKDVKRPDLAINLNVLIEVCSAVLGRDDCLAAVWNASSAGLDTVAQRRPMAHEFTALIAGGRLVSVAAEADVLANPDRASRNSLWVADGLQYSKWLGRSIAYWAKCDISSDDIKLCAEVFARSLRLGYSDALMRQLITDMLLGPEENRYAFFKLFGQFSQLEQKRTIFAVLKHLSEVFLNKIDDEETAEPSQIISAAAGVVDRLIANGESRKTHLVSWLTSSTGAGLGESIGIRRAVLAALAQDKECINLILEKSINQFGDQLYIKHSPILQQQAHAQVLLLSAGYANRLSPLKLKMIMRSAAYLNTVSNRIGASQEKARFLGLAVGEALSSLIDGSDKKLDFKMEEMETNEAKFYKDLVKVTDQVGPIDVLITKPSAEEKRQPPAPKPSRPKPAPKPKKQPAAPSKFIIQEVSDSESEDEDLVRYAKPDSDPEDSDEDPTLVRRDKPKAPVYIRDLLSYLRDTDNYDKQKLALTTAPTLIRRKANFGTEVTDHAEELATLLVGLQDKFEIENFWDLRLQGMMAVVVAQPQKMGQWFAKTFFDGDYSVSQRASVLIVLGLSARELAGFDASEYAAAASFPSKRLPEKMEALYLGQSTSKKLPSSTLKALPSNALDTIANSLTSAFMAPIAANAADATTGPDALKLSTFTSRLQNTTSKKKTGLRSIPNTTASVLSTYFFFPLTARFQHALRSHSARSGVFIQSHLLSLYLKTLAVLIHSAGPATLALPQMTAELWDLLLGVRAHVSGDVPGTHALLIALAAMLEVNEATDMRRLCEAHPREVVETQEWVSGIFNNTRGEDGGEENDVKMLAAAVLIKLQEATEKYRALLLGDMIGFQ
ncbi:DNA replication checkpoint protein tel2 [Colletotrichum sp. SAR 10_70]|nr:DNA replication checkpoint protein tel2 [Colletotrichum sp. SAR 10_71]KAI8172375.1 DNA replication checkpoint protein tel2 [Colletotrichum sp. SAR 10_70]KAI8178869.1 DNA replication checkpoint protein tel2 [Colletotrichum sp. SAR 10_65]KAI8182613.1 DNA replication checkpoint protein tel2 [Colletotrichum sp. SAR 10_75]KAI8230299.1 DNA replication checkpoint protein tel2 [Colletotrichum sp. SAR 10_86]KAI8252478.1 DNA replication checkpoint protein tel2 [Colletotrichum sp. SAR 10_77]KAJ500140